MTFISVFNRYSAFNTLSKIPVAQSPMAIDRATNLPSVHCRRRTPSAMKMKERQRATLTFWIYFMTKKLREPEAWDLKRVLTPSSGTQCAHGANHPVGSFSSSPLPSLESQETVRCLRFWALSIIFFLSNRSFPRKLFILCLIKKIVTTHVFHSFVAFQAFSHG